MAPDAVTTRRGSSRRVLEALETSSLVDLAAAYALPPEVAGGTRETLLDALTVPGRASAAEVLCDLLSAAELRRICEELGSPADGPRARLARRLLKALSSWRPFAEARQFARSLALGSREQWKLFCRGLLPEMGSLPVDVPRRPERSYKRRGWRGWGDWLDSEPPRKRMGRRVRSFEQARAFVRRLGLSTQSEWWAYCHGDLRTTKGEKPDDIPALPHEAYNQEGWRGMHDWLGTVGVPGAPPAWWSYRRARRFVRALALKEARTRGSPAEVA